MTVVRWKRHKHIYDNAMPQKKKGPHISRKCGDFWVIYHLTEV